MTLRGDIMWLKRKRKLFILSIDGLPFSFLQQAFAKGLMPEFKSLCKEGSLVRISSTIPTISSVAWATFMTGVNPAKHNIYGFVDMDDEMNLFIPNAAYLKAKTIWERLSDLGRKVIVINVPVTYPPKPVNGVLVSGFLGTDLNKSTYPLEVAYFLQDKGYIIDPDPRKAKTDKDGFLEDIFKALEGRRMAALHFLEEDNWDFFMLHVMETDRINHFYWEAKDDPQNEYHQRFWEFYRKVDDLIGELCGQVKEFMILSDHGFCSLKWEVDLNEYLKREGLLKFNGNKINPNWEAYSLIPGRVFLNEERKEKEKEKEKEIISKLFELNCNGKSVIERVWRREELYLGPYLERSAHLIATAHKGYELKGKINSGKLFDRSHISGMHTYEDALVYIKGHLLETEDAKLIDVTPTVFRLLGLPIPGEFEGRSLI
jgi:predicted AlkP superfamily phosphohydrolase/phosphomutase